VREGGRREGGAKSVKTRILKKECCLQVRIAGRDRMCNYEAGEFGVLGNQATEVILELQRGSLPYSVLLQAHPKKELKKKKERSAAISEDLTSCCGPLPIN